MPTEATEYAKLLMGFYRATDLNDPRAFAAGVTAILCLYPRDVVRQVCGPTGLPSKVKFLPTIAEVREACEVEMEPRRRQWERERRITDTTRLLEAPRENRPTLNELKERFGATWGIEGERRLTEALETLEQIEERLMALREEAEAGVPLQVSDALRARISEMMSIAPREEPRGKYERDPRPSGDHHARPVAAE